MRAAVSLGAFAARCSLSPDRSALRPAVRAEYRSYPAAFFHPRTEISTGLTLVELRGGGSGGTLGSGASTSFALTAQFFMRARIIAKPESTRRRFAVGAQLRPGYCRAQSLRAAFLRHRVGRG